MLRGPFALGYLSQYRLRQVRLHEPNASIECCLCVCIPSNLQTYSVMHGNHHTLFIFLPIHIATTSILSWSPVSMRCWLCLEYSRCCTSVHVWLTRPLKKLCHPICCCSAKAWVRPAWSSSSEKFHSNYNVPTLSHSFIAVSMIVIRGLEVPAFFIHLQCSGHIE